MSFLNVIEIESALGGLCAAYPGVTELVRLPFATAEGRWCHALRIRSHWQCACRRSAVLIVSGAHAREWGGPDIVVDFAADLLEAYAAGSALSYGGASFSAAQIASIVERLEVIVVPDLNPDGRNHSQTVAPMWRKNRNPASSGGDPDRIGVDVNRNYDFLWDFPTKFAPGANPTTVASTDPASDLFHGAAGFSEAETQNVRWLFERYPWIRWFMDVHSFGGDILFSWGDDEDQTTDPSMAFGDPGWDHRRGVSGDAYREYIPAGYLSTVQSAATAVRDAIASVRGQPYTSAQSFGLPGWPGYPTSGASDDWSFSRHFADPSRRQTFGFTLEFNPTSTFFPSWAEMTDIIRDVDAGLVAFCLNARPGWLWVTWCHILTWLSDRVWHRLFPPELWGPYGPWTRLRRAVYGGLGRSKRRS